MSIPSWVKVGADLIEVRVSIHGTHYGRRVKIGKIHKTGRFVLEGDTTQWTPGLSYASRGGQYRYSSATLEPYTDEVKVAMDRQQLVAAARHAVRTEIDRLTRVRDDDGLIAEYERLTAK